MRAQCLDGPRGLVGGEGGQDTDLQSEAGGPFIKLQQLELRRREPRPLPSGPRKCRRALNQRRAGTTESHRLRKAGHKAEHPE